MKYLNLGCGARYHPDWINIDIQSSSPAVLAHDLTRGIPLPDASCEVVYHSNMLEHLRRANALPFLRECCRVLVPGGILRIAVPDLERICRIYLAKLSQAAAESPAAAWDYEWILLEMYDQTVRERPGGAMAEYLRRESLPNEDFVFGRIGEEGRQLVAAMRRPMTAQPRPDMARRVYRWLRGAPRGLRERLLRLLLGRQDSRALEIGRFRLRGEVHQWMYDRYSLARLLTTAGFVSPVLQNAGQSQIPDWNDFHLDTLPDGSTIKPDSFFMEARRPDQP